MSIAARVPVYVQPIPAVSDKDKTDRDEIILRLRGHNPEPAQQAWRTRVNRCLGNYYLCVVAFILKAVFLFDTPPPNKKKVINFSNTLSWFNYFSPFAVKFAALLFAGLYLLGMLKGEDPYPAGKFGRVITIFFIFSQRMVPIVVCYLGGEWYSIGNQLNPPEGSRVDKACPLLCSDPAANWIWAIG